MSKHFTDAELAAEYWESTSEYHCHGHTEAVTFIAYEREIWARFAIHPHALEGS